MRRDISLGMMTVTLRRYIGDAIIEDGVVTMQCFAGGYFDANGVANYYIADYQGNVTEVVNASGVVVQSVRYYPDGEPWMEPTGTNRYTFGGKERVNLGGLNQYDFGPRLLNAAAGVWGAPDRKAEKYYGISPYSYCAGNPVMFTNPTGELIEGDLFEWNYVKKELEDRRRETENSIRHAERNAKKRNWNISDKDWRNLTNLRSIYKYLKGTISGMNKAEASSTKYNIRTMKSTDQGIYSARNVSTGKVDVVYDILSTLVHEIQHVGQNEYGNIRFQDTSEKTDYVDITDEVSAFRAQYAVSSIYDINGDWVRSIKNRNGTPYAPGGENRISQTYVGSNSSTMVKNMAKIWK